MNLTELILCSNDNKDNFEDIYSKFKKRIDFLTRSFDIELYKNDLLLLLWQLIKKLISQILNLRKLCIHIYIYIYLENYCINLYNKYHKNNKVIYNSMLTNIEIDKNYSYNPIDSSTIIFDELIVNLSEKQKKVITMRYKYCLSDCEIANSLSISRQAVYKNRMSALNKLHRKLCS